MTGLLKQALQRLTRCKSQIQNETAQSSADGFSDRGRRRVRGALNWSPYCRTIATAGSSRMPTPPRSWIGRTALMRCAPVVAVIGAAWLLLALPIDLLLRLSPGRPGSTARARPGSISGSTSAGFRPTARAVAARNRRLSRAGALILGLPTGSAAWYQSGRRRIARSGHRTPAQYLADHIRAFAGSALGSSREQAPSGQSSLQTPAHAVACRIYPRCRLKQT